MNINNFKGGLDKFLEAKITICHDGKGLFRSQLLKLLNSSGPYGLK